MPPRRGWVGLASDAALHGTTPIRVNLRESAVRLPLLLGVGTSVDG
jgi:hypothetical protein